ERECLGIPAPVEQVTDEDTREEENLLGNEEPHPDFRRVKLLNGRLEVMGEKLRTVLVSVCFACHSSIVLQSGLLGLELLTEPGVEVLVRAILVVVGTTV